jgi:hypothetical protein
VAVSIGVPTAFLSGQVKHQADPRARVQLAVTDEPFNLLHLIADQLSTLTRIHRLRKPDGLFISKTPCLSGMNPLIRVAVPVMRFAGKAPFVSFFAAPVLAAEITNANFAINETINESARLGQVARMPGFIWSLESRTRWTALPRVRETYDSGRAPTLRPNRTTSGGLASHAPMIVRSIVDRATRCPHFRPIKKSCQRCGERYERTAFKR